MLSMAHSTRSLTLRHALINNSGATFKFPALSCSSGTSSSTRLLHSSAGSRARLVESHTSVTPGGGLQLPPSAPYPQRDTPHHRRSTPVAPLQSGKLRGTKRSTFPAPPPPSAIATNTATIKSTASIPKVDLGAIVALDLFLLRTLSQLHVSASTLARAAASTTPSQLHKAPSVPYLSLSSLLHQSTLKNGLALDEDLAYESTPNVGRRVRTDGVNEEEVEASKMVGVDINEEQDGVVWVCHVVGGEVSKTNTCLGFAIGDGRILTCAHTLQSMQQYLPPPGVSSAPSPPSASFILSSSGHVWPVTSLESSLLNSDLLILGIPTDPLRSQPPTSAASLSTPAPPVPRLRTLPVSPYPAPVGSTIATVTYRNPMSPLPPLSTSTHAHQWVEGIISSYQDAMGSTAETGTYDDLAMFKWGGVLPKPGSSGSPIVDVSSGAVVGIVRGTTQGYGDRQKRGWATPAQAVFEMFRLPGFKPKSAILREKEAAAAAQAAAARLSGAELEALAGEGKGEGN